MSLALTLNYDQSIACCRAFGLNGSMAGTRRSSLVQLASDSETNTQMIPSFLSLPNLNDSRWTVICLILCAHTLRPGCSKLFRHCPCSLAGTETGLSIHCCRSKQFGLWLGVELEGVISPSISCRSVLVVSVSTLRIDQNYFMCIGLWDFTCQLQATRSRITDQHICF